MGRGRELLALALAVLAGAGVAAQARLNGGLGLRVGPLVAADVSNTVGFLAILAVVATHPGRRAAAARIIRPGGRWWWRAVGLIGAAFVAVSAWAVPRLGVALVSVASLGGQTAASLGVDRAGIAPGGRRALSPARLAGAGLGVAAVVVAAFGGVARSRPLVVLVVFAVGAATAVQAAGNAHLRLLTGNATSSVLANFATGLAGLLAVTALVAVLRGLPPRAWPANPVLYLGGFFGVVFVAVVAVVVGRLGVLAFTLASIAGQLTGALVLDVVVPAGRGHVGPASVAGVVLALLAVLVTAWRRPGVRPARPAPAGEGTA